MLHTLLANMIEKPLVRPVTFESSQTSVNRRKVVLHLFLCVTVVAVNKANATLDAGQSSARKSLPARPLTAAAERKRATSFTSDAYIAHSTPNPSAPDPVRQETLPLDL
uniref:Uncharacterized protein n=1 Tax=Trichogramma kaykai TaxID=54128 RepID=A0ABD2VZD6_9HYME